MGLTFFAGGGGAVSVWNSSESKWLDQTWEIPARKFLACGSATAAGGAKGYAVCGGGEGDGTRVDIFEVAGVGGFSLSLSLSLSQQGSLSLSSPLILCHSLGRCVVLPKRAADQ
eukprot:COSAG03_NODE_1827_length_3463_cov_17.326694_1_plen_113_part_10